ncbi:hypothetical protein [Mycoplasmopsis felis]|nr:hypothetical protein [Mycoplasmopsis felis]UWV84124.1 hypothetical protein NWE58_01180 [Mycoplasmopsis felis]
MLYIQIHILKWVDDYKYLSKHTKRLLRLAYIIFDIENAKQYDNFMREM